MLNSKTNQSKVEDRHRS